MSHKIKRRGSGKPGKRTRRGLSMPTQTDAKITAQSFSGALSYSWAAASTINSLAIYPDSSLFPNFYAAAAQFEFYRIISMSFRLVPTGGTTPFALCYMPYVPGNTALSSYALVSDQAGSYEYTPTSRSAKYGVKRDLLRRTPEHWYNTDPDGSSSKYNYLQGKLYIAPSATYTGSFTFMVKMVVEFTAPTSLFDTLTSTVICTSESDLERDARAVAQSRRLKQGLKDLFIQKH